MPPDELDDFKAELKAWAKQAPHGEQAKLAKTLGVSRQRLNNWVSGRIDPNARDLLKLQTFLKTQRRKK